MSFLTRSQLLEDVGAYIFTNDNEEISGDTIAERLNNIINNFYIRNSAKDITLAGNLDVAGGFDLTLTLSAASNATFPAGSGTLAYQEGDNTWTGINIFEAGNTVTFKESITFAEATGIVFGTASGTQIGRTASQKFSFWGNSPVVRPTTGIAASAFVANGSGITNDSATFGGYTIGQIVAALKTIGLLSP